MRDQLKKLQRQKLQLWYKVQQWNDQIREAGNIVVVGEKCWL